MRTVKNILLWKLDCICSWSYHLYESLMSSYGMMVWFLRSHVLFCTLLQNSPLNCPRTLLRILWIHLCFYTKCHVTIVSQPNLRQPLTYVHSAFINVCAVFLKWVKKVINYEVGLLKKYVLDLHLKIQSTMSFQNLLGQYSVWMQIPSLTHFPKIKCQGHYAILDISWPFKLSMMYFDVASVCGSCMLRM